MKRALSVLLVLVLVLSALSVTVLADEREPLEEMNITVTGVEVGKSTADVKVEVPAGVPYTVGAVMFWSVDAETEVKTEFTGTFEDGKLYDLEFNLDIDDSYDAGAAHLYVNGEWGDEWYQTDPDRDDIFERLVVTHRFSFLKKVESVAITGMQEPKIGDELLTTGLSVPADAPYTIQEVYWEDSTWDELPAGTKFEDGKAYYLVIELISKTGWEFTDDTQATVDGEEAWDTSNYDRMFMVYVPVSFKKPIGKIEFAGLDAPVAGQALDTQVTAKMDGQELPVTITWYDEDGNEVTTCGEKGIYTVEVRADYPTNYELAAGTQIILNGKSTMFYIYSVHSYVYIEKNYALGYETLDKLELTMEGFEEGKDADDTEITAKDRKVLMTLWGEGDPSDAELFEGNFEKDKKYMVIVATDLPENTFVDEHTKVYLNGQLQKNVEIVYEDGAASLCIYDLQINKPATPVTGDNTPVAALAAVLVLSAMMLVALPVAMKRKEQ